MSGPTVSFGIKTSQLGLRYEEIQDVWRRRGGRGDQALRAREKRRLSHATVAVAPLRLRRPKNRDPIFRSTQNFVPPEKRSSCTRSFGSLVSGNA